MLSPAYPSFEPLQVGWRLPPGLPLAFRAIGETLAVFNAESEDTHLLDPVAGGLLRRLAAGEVLVGDGLAEATGPLADAGFEPGEVLRELHVLGLAEPFQP
jgi:hypothetical protein